MTPFGGETYDAERDGDRLKRQLSRVKKLMLDGRWRTLQQIADHTGDPPASVSARLRDLRKSRFGAYVVERRHIKRGLWEYRVLNDPEPNPFQLRLVQRKD